MASHLQQPGPVSGVATRAQWGFLTNHIHEDRTLRWGLYGHSADGSVDLLDGGLGTDFCQGPAPDGDVLISCNL